MQKLRALSLISVIGLAACGGGDDGGGSSGEGPAPVAVTFSDSNYQQAAQEALASSSSLTSLPTGVQTTDTASLMRFGKDQYLKLKELRSSAPAVATGATSTQTFYCGVSGTVTVSFTYASDVVDTPGDSFASTYNQCVEQGVTVNGVLVATLQSSTYSNTGYSLRLGLDYRNLRFTTSASSVLANGGFVFTEDWDATSNQYDGTMTVGSFTLAASYGPTTYTRGLSNFNASYTDTSTSTTESVNGRVTSSALGNQYVTIATLSPFVTVGADAYPSSGQLTLVGSGGGKVRITAVNNSYVRIELDAAGDGVYELAVQKLWSSMN